MELERDNLVRLFQADVALRADPPERADPSKPASLGTLFGHFTVYDEWTEIDSWFEGNFMERIAPGAAARTIREDRSRIKVLYEHGRDPQVGNKPLGPIEVLRDEKTGPYYEVKLLRTSYNADLVPGLADGLYGASFRFTVEAERIEWEPPASAHNPKGLPERTIEDFTVWEFGPVTFPAYTSATAGMRSGTDAFIEALQHDPRFVLRFTERVGANVAERLLSQAEARRRPTGPKPPPAADGPMQTLRDRVSAWKPSTPR